jgi:hypothetical protein
MDMNDMLIDMLNKQLELLKARSPDHQLHCEHCGMMIPEEGHYRIMRKWLKITLLCEVCWKKLSP